MTFLKMTSSEGYPCLINLEHIMHIKEQSSTYNGGWYKTVILTLDKNTFYVRESMDDIIGKVFTK